MKSAAIFLTAGVALLFLSCVQGGKKISLRYKFEPGTHMVYETTFKGNARTYVGDSLTMDRMNEITLTTTSTVKQLVSDSIAEVEESYSYHIKRSDRLSSTVSDTTTEPETWHLQLLPNGKLIGVEVEGAENGNEQEYYQRYYEQGMPEFPSHELTQGESWTQRSKVVVDGKSMEAATTYRVESFARERGHDCVVLNYDGNMILPFSANPSDSVKKEGVHNLTVTGVMYFAYERGMVISQRERRIVDGTGRSWTGKNSSKAKEYRLAIEYDIDLRLVKLERDGV